MFEFRIKYPKKLQYNEPFCVTKEVPFWSFTTILYFIWNLRSLIIL